MSPHRRTALALPAILAVLCAPAVAHAGVSVEIEGVGGPLEANVRAALSITRAPENAAGAQVGRLHERAPDEIRHSLEPFGHYSPLIEASLEPDGEGWKARYVIDPGPQVHVSFVDVTISDEGGEDPGFREVRDAFPLRPGDPLSHANYELGKGKLLAYAASKGYFDAAFDSAAILVSVQDQTAGVVVHLDSGPRYLFGPIDIQQDVLDDRMLTGYVTILPGEPYDVEPLARMQDELSSGPYFGAVEIHPRREDAEDLRIPIDIKLFPSKPQRYEVGAGYGTDTGFRGKVRGEWRRLNRMGHYAEAELQASQIEFSASTKYTIPWPYPRTEVLTIFGGVGRFEPRWATSLRVATGANLGRSRGGWRQVISLAFEHENFTIAGVDGNSTLIIPGVSLSQTRADAIRYITKGHRLRFDVSAAHTALLSSATYAQVRAEAKIIRSPFARCRVLARGSAGRTYTGDFEELPPTQRFVTGGDQTVRGYAYESLGPRNAAGDIVGGNSLLIGGIETDYRIVSDFACAVFADVGGALTDFDGELSTGVGGGVRWISPIGIVRLDGAVAVSEDDAFRIHLSIGPDL